MGTSGAVDMILVEHWVAAIIVLLFVDSACKIERIRLVPVVYRRRVVLEFGVGDEADRQGYDDLEPNSPALLFGTCSW